MGKIKPSYPLILASAFLLLTACSTIGNVPFSAPTSTLTPFQPEPATPSPTPPPRTPTEAQPTLWIGEAIPPSLRQAVTDQGWALAADSQTAGMVLDVLPSGEGTTISTRWVYALVAPFPTLVDEVSAADLRRAWAGESVGPFAGRPLWMSTATLAAFSALWGAPTEGAVHLANEDELLTATWNERPAWAIIPFEQLEPRWKVLSVDGQSPIHNDFDAAQYPLLVHFGCRGARCTDIRLPPTNRDPSRLTVLIMTGVTALVRATAWRMEQKGITYPAQDIGEWLRTADITHISNEIPFAEDCPYPDPSPVLTRFCSNPRYIALLEDIGADVIELTGNHFQDWGTEATLYTLELYRQRGWPYYGGGADLSDSRKAVTIEHNGNRLAFIGCNPVGPYYAWATESRPGAAPCEDYVWMTAEISRLKAEGYLVIATFQYHEYYTPEPRPEQQRDFRNMALAGAVIVSGSQAHAPQAMEFYQGAFIHYGLGNLFFDQMEYILPDGKTTTRTRQEFLDRHVFYDGRYISTELLTAMLEEYARPRPMTAEERLSLLEEIFAVSGW